MVETLFTILPFLAILLISLSAYYRYKNRGKEEESTWTDKYSFFGYIKLVFIERTKYRPLAVVFAFPFWFGLLFGILSFVLNIERLIYPPLPLGQMQTKQGMIESIAIRKKMDDLLIFKTKDGKMEQYAYELYESKDRLIGKNVIIYYTKGFSSGFTIDNIVYQINSIDTDRSIELHPYNYERSLQINKSFWKFTMWSFIIGFLSGAIVWYINKKESSVYRLNRIKYKKIRKVRDERYKKLFD